MHIALRCESEKRCHCPRPDSSFRREQARIPGPCFSPPLAMAIAPPARLPSNPGRAEHSHSLSRSAFSPQHMPQRADTGGRLQRPLPLRFAVRHFLLSISHRRAIKRPLLTRQYSRSRPPQREKRLSQTLVFPRGEPSVFPVGSGHGPLRKRPWAKARPSGCCGRSRKAAMVAVSKAKEKTNV